jgi:hypothetical protein
VAVRARPTYKRRDMLIFDFLVFQHYFFCGAKDPRGTGNPVLKTQTHKVWTPVLPTYFLFYFIYIVCDRVKKNGIKISKKE